MVVGITADEVNGFVLNVLVGIGDAVVLRVEVKCPGVTCVTCESDAKEKIICHINETPSKQYNNMNLQPRKTMPREKQLQSTY